MGRCRMCPKLSGNNMPYAWSGIMLDWVCNKSVRRM